MVTAAGKVAPKVKLQTSNSKRKNIHGAAGHGVSGHSFSVSIDALGRTLHPQLTRSVSWSTPAEHTGEEHNAAEKRLAG